MTKKKHRAPLFSTTHFIYEMLELIHVNLLHKKHNCDFAILEKSQGSVLMQKIFFFPRKIAALYSKAFSYYIFQKLYPFHFF